MQDSEWGVLPLYSFNPNLNLDVTSLYNTIVNEHLQYDYIADPGSSFILQPSAELELIYDAFMQLATSTFGPLTLLTNNSRRAWGHITNKDYYTGGVHNHIRTSVINGVYYLTVPTNTIAGAGTISFYHTVEESSEIKRYQPSPGELIIMPNWLYHQPHQSYTDTYRIAINVELQCAPVVW